MIPGSERDGNLQAGNRRILIVDDNPAIHEDFRKVLGASMPAVEGLAELEAALFGEAGAPAATTTFEMDSAFQGQEALKLVTTAQEKNRPYAMAFLDVRMPPGWDGIETAGRIWELSKHQGKLCEDLFGANVRVLISGPCKKGRVRPGTYAQRLGWVGGVHRRIGIYGS